MPDHQVAGYDNAAFWNERYGTNLAIGSGRGSRGELLVQKRLLLQEVIARIRPRSILDVGCGDIEATRELEFDGSYTGIDVSPYIIERNRTIRPDWGFMQGDFVELADTRVLAADLVICIDVLIHQHDRDTYREFVCKLLDAARCAIVVNGFYALPRSGRLSPNVAFHEPITETLRWCGVEPTEILATVRRTAIVLVDTRGSLPR